VFVADYLLSQFAEKDAYWLLLTRSLTGAATTAKFILPRTKSLLQIPRSLHTYTAAYFSQTTLNQQFSKQGRATT
jgi:hypothetical protein